MRLWVTVAVKGDGSDPPGSLGNKDYRGVSTDRRFVPLMPQFIGMCGFVARHRICMGIGLMGKGRLVLAALIASRLSVSF